MRWTVTSLFQPEEDPRWMPYSRTEDGMAMSIEIVPLSYCNESREATEGRSMADRKIIDVGVAYEIREKSI